MWVINDEQVSTFTSNSSTNTDSEVFTTFVGTPSPSRLRVSPQRQLWENLYKIIIIDKVTNLSAETHRQLRSVGRLDNLLFGELPQKPSRE